jgi:hypothetical protein
MDDRDRKSREERLNDLKSKIMNSEYGTDNHGGDDENMDKVTLLDQLSISMLNPRNYKQLLKLKTGRVVLFIVVVSFLFAFLEFGIAAISWVSSVGGFDNLATNIIPAFTWQDGKLDMERETQIEVGDSVIYFNTEKLSVPLTDMESDGVYITVGSNIITIGMVADGQAYTYMEMPLSYMMISEGFDNNQLAKLSTAFYVYLVFVFIFVMIGKAAKQLLLALIFSIMANALAKNINSGLTFGKVYTICIYGVTLPMLLMSVNVALGYMISSLVVWCVSLMIGVAFINRALMSYKFTSAPPWSD